VIAKTFGVIMRRSRAHLRGLSRTRACTAAIALL
jgi:hypothetical protein